MDTVILAAGRGSRLEGIMAPFHKPLLVVSGEPIILGAAKRAWLCTGERVVLVVAPENALPIAQIMQYTKPLDRYDMIIQPRPEGPGDALLRGLQLATSEYVLVLLGDNVTTFADIRLLASCKGNTVGVQQIPQERAFRFTRLRADGSWVEKVPVTDADVDPATGEVLIWVGPIVVNREEMIRSLKLWEESLIDSTRELLIGPTFNDLTDVKCVNVSSIDIGVPEELPK